MTIGIVAVAAFKTEKTGIEWYVYNLIKGLTKTEDAKKHHFILYTNLFRRKRNKKNSLDFPLPNNFKIKKLRWPLSFFWTQIRLSFEMIFNRPNILLCPSHIAPIIHPKKTIVAIHGFEYEYCLKMYPFFKRLYLKWATKFSFYKAWKIIVPSENTKNDILKFFGQTKKIIEIIPHGINAEKIGKFLEEIQPRLIQENYILYIGRIEKRKNISGVIKIFKLLKNKYNIPHKLILAGPFGYGYNEKQLKQEIGNYDIKYLGYIPEEQKYNLLKYADLFIFIPFYEGFGIPILEARAFNLPIVYSDIFSLIEIAGDSALKIDSINDMTYDVLNIKDLISGHRKSIDLLFLQKYSWQKIAEQTLKFLL